MLLSHSSFNFVILKKRIANVVYYFFFNQCVKILWCGALCHVCDQMQMLRVLMDVCIVYSPCFCVFFGGLVTSYSWKKGLFSCLSYRICLLNLNYAWNFSVSLVLYPWIVVTVFLQRMKCTNIIMSSIPGGLIEVVGSWLYTGLWIFLNPFLGLLPFQLADQN